MQCLQFIEFMIIIITFANCWRPPLTLPPHKRWKCRVRYSGAVPKYCSDGFECFVFKTPNQNDWRKFANKLHNSTRYRLVKISEKVEKVFITSKLQEEMVCFVRSKVRLCCTWAIVCKSSKSSSTSWQLLLCSRQRLFVCAWSGCPCPVFFPPTASRPLLPSLLCLSPTLHTQTDRQNHSTQPVGYYSTASHSSLSWIASRSSQVSIL